MASLLQSRFLSRPTLQHVFHARQSLARFLSATSQNSSSSPFQTGPAPPRLPKEEQEIFEKLQQSSTGAFSTPQSTPETATATAPTQQAESSSANSEQHPDLRTGAKPEFEGEQNPKTGEVGGPKNEPLRWGAGGDWSFNGRVTDF